MKRSMVVSLALIAGLLFAGEARAVRLEYTNGYCRLLYNGSENVNPDYYDWDPEWGRLWLDQPGMWWARYYTYQDTRGDIPEVGAYTMFGEDFHLILYGKDLIESCDFDHVYTAENHVELVVLEGGSVKPGVTFPGPPEFDVVAAVATERDNARDQDAAQFWSDALDILLR